MDWLFAPFEVSFVQRALWGGLLVSCLCAVAGTWVVVRGMAFLSDAMAHGMLPGVAIASLLGGNLLLGAAASAAAMAVGVTVLSRNRRMSADTGIGLLFVGMLALGVIIVSRSQSFAVDLTGFLFGDVLATSRQDLLFLSAALLIALVVTVLGHRAFLALTFDPRIAQTLGLAPRRAQFALVGLLTLAIVASFHIVGTLLVFGLLIAPPAAALFFAHRIPAVMVLAAVFGSASTVIGLLISWHAGTAAGATIAGTAVGLFFVSALVSRLREWVTLRAATTPVTVAAALALAFPLVGCGAGTEPAPAEPTPHGYVAGAEETAEAQPRLVVAERGSGAVRVVDLITEEVTELGSVDGVSAIAGDGRYAYLSAQGSTWVVDSGSWMVDHGDHVHYYRAAARELGQLGAAAVTGAYSDKSVATVIGDAGTTVVDRTALDEGSVRELDALAGAIGVPYAGRLVVASSGRIEVRSRDGAEVTALDTPCPNPRGQALTRRGVVIGCADGAVLVAEQDSRFTATKISDGMGEPADAFFHRPGSTTLVTRSGPDAVAVLEVSSRRWSRISTGPVVATNTAGAGTPIMVLTADGVLHGYDPVSGAEIARTTVLATPLAPGAPAPVIVVDSNRAYVNDPAARVVHEIDYNDNLRIARTFTLDIAPDLMVETGR
ncbi:metal ABC transporter permease [Nocardia cyriacigeorgica]|uniref:zinc ABC transporter permease AztB n=1 Tax=Nocardia cyriacigeorgica TaxID=135487 RepID=UPI00189484C3|nr:zinc ABC transporter permease AztB [Nocardia cyriacigeorgica]MBF6424273.1 metal ABC transporter permease [Nocardia cyriacigeorgica]